MAALYLDEDVRHSATELLKDGWAHRRPRAGPCQRRQGRYSAPHRSSRSLGSCHVQPQGLQLLHDAWQHWSDAWHTRQVHAGILLIHNEWPADVIARRIDIFFAQNLPATNRLYRFVADRGWIERISRRLTPPP